MKKRISIMRTDYSINEFLPSYQVGYDVDNYIAIVQEEGYTEMTLKDRWINVSNKFYNTDFKTLKLLLRDEIGREASLNEVFFRLKYGFK
ncbi:MAG: hypothetical protein ACRDBY_12855 [Cetobacterium sp.]